MKIEIVLVPSKSVPLASRVAPASTPATNGAKPAARWVISNRGHRVRFLFHVGRPPLDVDEDSEVEVALAKRRGPPSLPPILTPKWRLVQTPRSLPCSYKLSFRSGLHRLQRTRRRCLGFLRDFVSYLLLYIFSLSMWFPQF